MRIGIDARMINESGIGRYLKNLLTELQRLDRKNEYIIFLREKDFYNLKFEKNFSKVIANFSWYGMEEQIKLPIFLGKYKLDLVHFPHFNIPLLYGCHYVVTIHDLIHQHFQMRKATTLNTVTYMIKSLLYKLVFEKAVKESTKILTPTEFVKKQLIKEWKINSRKIVVTPEGVEKKIIKLTRKKIKPLVDGNYFFYIGNAHPHKNLETLIQAFKIVRQKRSGLKLVLSGKENFFWKRLKDNFQGDGIIYTGFVNDLQMVGLYQNASAFVMPSLEEGFGIPVVEAMACGCPVIASDIGVFREVGGAAILYFNPKDENDIAEKMIRVISDKVIRDKLIKEGSRRYKQFSWERCAKQTMEVYARSLGS